MSSSEKLLSQTRGAFPFFRFRSVLDREHFCSFDKTRSNSELLSFSFLLAREGAASQIFKASRQSIPGLAAVRGRERLTTMMFPCRWLAGIVVIFIIFQSSSLPALGQAPPAPAPSLSSDESVRNALREAPLPEQSPASSSPPAPPASAPAATAANVDSAAADDEKHVAVVHEAAALYAAILDPAAAIIEIGARSKTGVTVRERERERRERVFSFRCIKNVLPCLPSNKKPRPRPRQKNRPASPSSSTPTTGAPSSSTPAAASPSALPTPRTLRY